MADICEYHVLVKGQKNACYALYGSMPMIMGSEKNIEYQGGTEKDYQIVFKGQCKWSVDYGSDMYDELEIQIIPDGQNEAISFGEDYLNVSLQGKSKIFQIEVWCNSVDLDKFHGICSYHFNNGKDESIPYEDMPEQIAMSVFEEFNDEVSEFDDSLEEMNTAVWELNIATVKKIIEHYNLRIPLEKEEDFIKCDLQEEIMTIAENEDRLPMDVFLEMKDIVES